MNDPNPIASTTPPGQGSHDEISLLDLWKVLTRRKRFIVSVGSAIFLLGILYGVIRPPVHAFQTTIHAGQDRSGDPVMNSEALAELLREDLVAAALHEAQQDAPETAWPDINVLALEHSPIVRLRSTAPPEAGDHVFRLHADVVERSVDEHRDDLSRARAETQDRIEDEQLAKRGRREDLEARMRDRRLEFAFTNLRHQEELRELASTIRSLELDRTDRVLRFKQEETSLSQRIEQHRLELSALADQQELVTQHVALLEEQMESVRALRDDLVINGTPEEPWVLAIATEPRTTLLRMERQIQQDQAINLPSQLGDLQNRQQKLKLDLAHLTSEQELSRALHEEALNRLDHRIDDRQAERAALEREFKRSEQEFEHRQADLEAELERVATRHEQTIRRLERELDNIRDTRLRGDIAVMSARPTGPGLSLFAALSLVLGVMLGIFGAFFREFLANVRAAEEA